MEEREELDNDDYDPPEDYYSSVRIDNEVLIPAYYGCNSRWIGDAGLLMRKKLLVKESVRDNKPYNYVEYAYFPMKTYEVMLYDEDNEMDQRPREARVVEDDTFKEMMTLMAILNADDAKIVKDNFDRTYVEFWWDDDRIY